MKKREKREGYNKTHSMRVNREVQETSIDSHRFSGLNFTPEGSNISILDQGEKHSKSVSDKLQKSGLKELKNRDYRKSLYTFNKVIGNYPYDYLYFSNRAKVKFQLGKYSTCIEDCKIAIELNQSDSNSYYLQSQSLLKLGFFMRSLNVIDLFLGLYHQESNHKFYELKKKIIFLLATVDKSNNKLIKQVSSKIKVVGKKKKEGGHFVEESKEGIEGSNKFKIFGKKDGDKRKVMMLDSIDSQQIRFFLNINFQSIEYNHNEEFEGWFKDLSEEQMSILFERIKEMDKTNQLIGDSDEKFVYKLLMNFVFEKDSYMKLFNSLHHMFHCSFLGYNPINFLSNEFLEENSEHQEIVKPFSDLIFVYLFENIQQDKNYFHKLYKFLLLLTYFVKVSLVEFQRFFVRKGFNKRFRDEILMLNVRNIQTIEGTVKNSKGSDEFMKYSVRISFSKKRILLIKEDLMYLKLIEFFEDNLIEACLITANVLGSLNFNITKVIKQRIDNILRLILNHKKLRFCNREICRCLSNILLLDERYYDEFISYLPTIKLFLYHTIDQFQLVRLIAILSVKEELKREMYILNFHVLLERIMNRRKENSKLYLLVIVLVNVFNQFLKGNDSNNEYFVKYCEINDECKVCGKKTSKMCSRCKKVYYCSVKCQRKHWLIHKFLCKNSAKKMEKNKSKKVIKKKKTN